MSKVGKCVLMDLPVKNVIQQLRDCTILISIKGYIVTEVGVIKVKFVHFIIINRKEIMRKKCAITIENLRRIRNMILILSI